MAVPIDRPRFTFSGLYLPDEDDVPSPAPGERATSIQRITQEMIPLGVPMDVDTGELDEQAAFERRLDQERAGTAAFKLRLALPGSFGDEITAKVQSLRVLPDERHLGGEDVGAAVALPGGPGWPDHETVVTLRRIGIGEDENAPAADVRGEAGQFATVYNLYESQETVLLLADPRARRDYTLADVPDQDDVPGSRTADEKAQCRRCDYPVYFPDVETDPDHPDLDLVEEMLAGRYVRAFLFLDPDSPDTIRQNTRAALDFFDTQGDNYPLPTGWIETTAPAAPVPSPLQVSLAEPGLNAATWSPGEASVSVSLTAGEAIVRASDHNVSGRSMPFSFDRTYRSHMLGYGPLGSAGWGANLFAQLREIRTTGEVELYDGAGHVWRFYPNGGPLPDGWEEDPAGSYAAPKGVYLRLQKLAGDRGWRLIDRHHNTLEFDIEGRLARISDRHRRGGDAEEQGSTLHLFYDPFGQLERVHDDLGRDYFFTYLDDPTPTLDGGDGERYGLLETITDFVDREIEYTFSTERTLDEVELPEVKNPVSFYAEFSYEGSRRPTVRYEYDPQRGVSSEESNDTAVSHGDFAELRLENVFVPEFVTQAASTPRLRFEYETTSGRVKTVAFPTPQNTNSTASSVAWTITTPAFVDDMRPVEAATVRAPWGHDIEYTLVDGRSESVLQELLVTMPDGNATFQTVGPEFEYLDDGRVSQITQPDGGQTELCYPDSCDAGGSVDRLTLANVVKATTSSTEPGSQGTADYTSIVTTSSYQEDNLVTSMTDGLNRAIDVPVPISGGEDDALRFVAEGVRASLDYDAFGRSTDVTGGGVQPYTVRREFHPDAEGEEDSGLLKRVEQGTFGAPQMWTELDYDEQYNVDVSRTSRGTSTETTHDAWDRPVRVVSGLGDGRMRSVGTSECGEAPGAVVERAYDAAGHVIRERQLQDFVDVDGSVQCRFVETRYEYNAREQLTSVETTHLSDPARPGHVGSLSRRVSETRYDEHGRVREQRALNVVDPTLITTFRYDEAGRQVGARVGQAGETTLGWDVKGRVVLRTDGDEGVWRGRYDAWDRLFHEAKATGGVVLHRFDESGQPIEVTSWDADPLAPAGDAELLARTKTEYTSFGEMARLVEVLIDRDGERQVRVTEREFDDAGRLDRVLSGPAKVNADELDHARARREQAFRYEDLTGRLIEIAYGGEIGAPSEYVERFTYSDGTASPVPDAMARFESVPGEAGLVETWSERYVRDAFDRVIETRRNDGTVIYTTFDRGTQQVIRTRTGADTITRYGYDGVGRLIRQIRPNGRGATLYAYDTDGRIREQIAETRDAAEPWETRYTYDSTGRLLRTDYADDSFETVERYALDNQVLERTTRDGVRLIHTYDAANRLVSVVPSATARMASTLAPLDGGNASAWDTLSRPTRLDRGRPGVPDADPQLSVAYPSYDLASRVGTERVGGRSPIRWSYDEWNRPVTVDLPVGIGRADGAFRGFERRYDTLNRPVDVAAFGGELTATRSGLTWTWGGLNRLYGFDTKGTLGTASRTGYIDGRGPQPPDGNPDSAVWRPGTLTWGANGTTAGSPTAVPATTWGQFAFGWRGTEGDPRDGVKIGRLAVRGNADGLDAFAGMGWSWDYDAGLRLSSAVPGRGDLQGRRQARQAGFRYDYARGDELDRLVDEAAGTVGDVDSGAYGRITGRDGIDFGYDPAGRRTEDDRFVYTWNWRGELVEIAVKSGWDSPHAEHVVRYLYDASGRLHAREHWGAVPDGGGERPFVERREYLWEGQNLRAEVGFADPEATQARWRKTYVPGTGFDAPQVMVEDLAFPGDGPRLYTYLRDELGSVLGVVAERESADPRQPVIPARFFYTPYGEAYAESRPELRRGFFDTERTQVGGDEQRVEDPELAAPGSLLVAVSAALDPSTVPSGFAVETHGFGGWRAVDPAQVLVAPDDESTRVAISLRSGWRRGERYRVRPLSSLRDLQGRGLGSAEPIEWAVPAERDRSIAYDRHFAVRFDSAAASADTLGGRFPGGQNHLFHGLWTDPVTGVAYARARWYDPRNATWLSEDPMHDVDSPNLYAYVGWSPAMFVDPFGEESIRQWLDFDKDIEEGRKVEGYAQKTLYVVWNAVTFGFLGRHDKDYEETGGYFGDNREEYIAQTGRNLGRTAVEGGVSMATGGWGSAGARTLGSAVARGAAGGAASGLATTAAADLYERATGGEAMTVSDYVSGAVGGALFGGATGAFGAGTRADELWYKPNGTAKSTGWSNVTTRMNRRYHQQVHGTSGTRNPRVHDEFLDEAVAGERHHGVMAQRETGMLTSITDRVAPGLTPVIERFANRNTVLLSKTRHRMADRHAGGPGQGYELPWYLSGPVMKWNPYRVWLGLTPRWRAWGGVAVVGVGWSSYGATRGVMDAIEGED
ncbi:MAG: RHS repeat-associated core domain-containing protein [Acidobacteriota bacterium]